MMDCNTQDINSFKQTTVIAPIVLKCNLTLSPIDAIIRTLIVNTSNLTINCKGGSITNLIIQSKVVKGLYEPPKHISVMNCKVRSIRISGHSINGQGEINIKDSHTNINHTDYSQSVAPSGILFNNLTVTPNGQIALYISPGVTGVTMQNSVINGNSNSVAIYLDAESGYNKFIKNTISTKTVTRSLVAIDGSANNVFDSNLFSNLGNGGIFLYRNCGEGSAVRFQTPSNNTIINNKFVYKSCTMFTCKPGIWLSARNQRYLAGFGLPKLSKTYCDDDKGYWGWLKTSSTDDNDNSSGNVITGNAIPDSMILNTEFNYTNAVQ